jgi:hypothetical protein
MPIIEFVANNYVQILAVGGISGYLFVFGIVLSTCEEEDFKKQADACITIAFLWPIWIIPFLGFCLGKQWQKPPKEQDFGPKGEIKKC